MNLKRRTWYILIGILVVIILYIFRNTNYFLWTSSFLAFLFVFYLADKIFYLNFNKKHYIIFILIVTAGVLFSPLYFISPKYDKILHLLSPFFLCILIFYLANKTKLKFSTKLFITFSIMIMFLALFEIGEFLLDKLFDLKLQGVFLRDYPSVTKLNLIQGKNDDTMIDLILGVISSLVFVGCQAIIHKYNRLK